MAYGWNLTVFFWGITVSLSLFVEKLVSLHCIIYLSYLITLCIAKHDQSWCTWTSFYLVEYLFVGNLQWKFMM